eukprot:307070-Hanusia_phi.AAC.3
MGLYGPIRSGPQSCRASGPAGPGPQPGARPLLSPSSEDLNTEARRESGGDRIPGIRKGRYGAGRCQSGGPAGPGRGRAGAGPH